MDVNWWYDRVWMLVGGVTGRGCWWYDRVWMLVGVWQDACGRWDRVWVWSKDVWYQVCCHFFLLKCSLTGGGKQALVLAPAQAVKTIAKVTPPLVMTLPVRAQKKRVVATAVPAQQTAVMGVNQIVGLLQVEAVPHDYSRCTYHILVASSCHPPVSSSVTTSTKLAHFLLLSLILLVSSS